MGRYITPDANPTVLENKFVSVTSAAGFSTGDLVYQTGSGYGPVPDGAQQYGSFNIATTSAVLTPDTQNDSGYLKCIEPLAIASLGINVAKLTNGNYVLAYHKQTLGSSVAYPYFKILDSNDDIVVAETQIYSTTVSFNGNGFPINVVALTGGGFVVSFISNVSAVNRILYAVYDNSGGVVAAAQADTDLTTTNATGYANIYSAALSGGKFVLLCLSSTNIPNYRIYNADGTTSSTWTTFGTAATVPTNGGSAVGITARSDNTFAVFHLNSTGLNIYYDFRDATNASAASGNVVVGATTIRGGIQPVTLSTDKIIVLYGDNPNTRISKFTFAAGSTTPSATSATTITAVGARYYYQIFSVSLLTSDRYLVWYQDGGSPYFMFGNVYDSNDNSLGSVTSFPPFWGTNGTGLAAFTYVPSFVVGSSIKFYLSANVNSSIAAGTQSGLFYGLLDNTAYTYTPVQSLSTVKGTVSLGTTNYAKESSTPTKAYFYSNTTGTYSTTVAAAADVIPQTTLTQFAVNVANMTTLPNGNFAIVYRSSVGTFPTYLSIIDNLGTIVNNVLVESGTSVTGVPGLYRITALPNGYIAIVYASSATTILCRMYSSSGTLLAATTLATNGSSVASVASVPSITTLSPYNLFAVSYFSAATTISTKIVDSNGIVLTTLTDTTAASPTYISISGFKSGGFCINYRTSTFAYYFSYVRNSDTSYTRYVNNTSYYTYTSSTAIQNTPSISSQDNKIGYYTQYNGISYLNLLSETYSASSPFVGITGNPGITTSAGGYSTVIVTASGYYVIVANADTAFQTTLRFYYGSPALNNTSTWTQVTATTTAVLNTANNIVVATPLYDNVVAYATLNTSNFLVFGAINLIAATSSTTITSGSTVSTTALDLSPANRYSLLGVAATNCSAGGSGIVQTNGVATLSNSYPATTTQGFDFTSPTGFGVRGVINGRTVTMQE